MCFLRPLSLCCKVTKEFANGLVPPPQQRCGKLLAARTRYAAAAERKEKQAKSFRRKIKHTVAEMVI